MTKTAAQRNADAIRVLNDNFRSTFLGGRLLVTASVAELPVDVKARLLLAVQAFSDFNADNDPHREHDFGEIELEGEMYFFKLDYFDAKNEQLGSEDPSDPEKTTRVLTIMRADEY
jgi:Protein of unknown function (DUF3768)